MAVTEKDGDGKGESVVVVDSYVTQAPTVRVLYLFASCSDTSNCICNDSSDEFRLPVNLKLKKSNAKMFLCLFGLR